MTATTYHGGIDIPNSSQSCQICQTILTKCPVVVGHNPGIEWSKKDQKDTFICMGTKVIKIGTYADACKERQRWYTPQSMLIVLRYVGCCQQDISVSPEQKVIARGRSGPHIPKGIKDGTVDCCRNLQLEQLGFKMFSTMRNQPNRSKEVPYQHKLQH